MNQRKQINLQIVNELRDYICKHPEQRFGQVLRNVGIVNTVRVEDNIPGFSKLLYTNIFHEEPERTLKRVLDIRAWLEEQENLDAIQGRKNDDSSQG